MQLRPGCPADVKLLAALAKAAVAEASAAEKAWVDESMTQLGERVGLPLSHFVVAEKEGDLLGFAGIIGSQVTDVYVAGAARRQGVGQRLLQALEEASGAVAWWHVLALPGAIAFYERQGFVRQGEAVIAEFHHPATRLTKYFHR